MESNTPSENRPETTESVLNDGNGELQQQRDDEQQGHAQEQRHQQQHRNERHQRDEIFLNMQTQCDSILRSLQLPDDLLSRESSVNSSSRTVSSKASSSNAEEDHADQSPGLSLLRELANRIIARFEMIVETLHTARSVQNKVKKISNAVAASFEQSVPQTQSDPTVETTSNEPAICTDVDQAMKGTPTNNPCESQEVHGIPCEQHIKHDNDSGEVKTNGLMVSTALLLDENDCTAGTTSEDHQSIQKEHKELHNSVEIEATSAIKLHLEELPSGETKKFQSPVDIVNSHEGGSLERDSDAVKNSQSEEVLEDLSAKTKEIMPKVNMNITCSTALDCCQNDMQKCQDAPCSSATEASVSNEELRRKASDDIGSAGETNTPHLPCIRVNKIFAISVSEVPHSGRCPDDQQECTNSPEQLDLNGQTKEILKGVYTNAKAQRQSEESATKINVSMATSCQEERIHKPKKPHRIVYVADDMEIQKEGDVGQIHASTDAHVEELPSCPDVQHQCSNTRDEVDLNEQARGILQNVYSNVSVRRQSYAASVGHISGSIAATSQEDHIHKAKEPPRIAYVTDDIETQQEGNVGQIHASPDAHVKELVSCPDDQQKCSNEPEKIDLNEQTKEILDKIYAKAKEPLQSEAPSVGPSTSSAESGITEIKKEVSAQGKTLPVITDKDNGGTKTEKNSATRKNDQHFSSDALFHEFMEWDSAWQASNEGWRIIDDIDMERIAPFKDFVFVSENRTKDDENVLVLDPSKIPSKREFSGTEEYNRVMEDLLLFAQHLIEEEVQTERFVVTVHAVDERRSRLRSRKWVNQFYKLLKDRYSDRLKKCVLLKPSVKLKALVKLSLPFMSSEIKERIVLVKSRRNFATAQGL